MWVCRAGRGEKDIELFLENNKIYLAWEGYDVNLSSIKDFQQIKELVISEKHPEARTSLSNWSTQINVFINLMEKGDYVLLPYPKSRYYALAKINTSYEGVKSRLKRGRNRIRKTTAVYLEKKYNLN